MEEETKQKLDELETKIDAILTATQKTKKYMELTFWITVVVFVLPLLVLAIVIPKVINSYMSLLNSF